MPRPPRVVSGTCEAPEGLNCLPQSTYGGVGWRGGAHSFTPLVIKDQGWVRLRRPRVILPKRCGPM